MGAVYDTTYRSVLDGVLGTEYMDLHCTVQVCDVDGEI